MKEFIDEKPDIYLTVNAFAVHYKDSNYFYEMSQKYNNEKKVELEQIYSRLTVLHYIFALEALINRVLAKFCISGWPNFLKKEKEYLSLRLKFYLAPVLCGCKERFNVDIEPFQSFSEFVEIRHSFVHSRIPDRQLKIVHEETGNNGKIDATLNDKFPANFWSHTKIPRDINIIRYKDASRAKNMTESMINELDRIFEGKIKNKHLLNETLKFL